TRMPSSASIMSQASHRRQSISASKAFFLSGRLSVMVTTWPSRSTSTAGSDIPSGLAQAARRRPPAAPRQYLTRVRHVDSQAVATARAFNRIVTQRIGALDAHYLARDRPLGESRLLWEIGPEGCDVRALRTRLGLDSGYLSRLLRSLEAA